MNKVSEMNLVDVDKLIPYVNNARTHSKEQINKLRASIREFGFPFRERWFSICFSRRYRGP